MVLVMALPAAVVRSGVRLSLVHRQLEVRVGELELLQHQAGTLLLESASWSLELELHVAAAC